MGGGREPALTAGGAVAAAAALLAVLTAFGLPLSGTQQTAILTVVAAAAPIAAAFLTRAKVTPVLHPRASDGTPLAPVRVSAARPEADPPA